MTALVVCTVSVSCTPASIGDSAMNSAISRSCSLLIRAACNSGTPQGSHREARMSPPRCESFRGSLRPPGRSSQSDLTEPRNRRSHRSTAAPGGHAVRACPRDSVGDETATHLQASRTRAHRSYGRRSRGSVAELEPPGSARLFRSRARSSRAIAEATEQASASTGVGALRRFRFRP
jgi:hypothetical protein